MAETYEGFDGYVQIEPEDAGDLIAVGGIRHWSVRYVQETLEVSRFNVDPAVSSLERRFRRYKPGPLGWTASFDGFVMPEEAGQVDLQDAIADGREFHAYFHLDGTRYYHGKGLLTLENPDLAWDAVGTQSFEMQGTEALEREGWIAE